MLDKVFRWFDAILENDRSFRIFMVVFVLSTFWIGAWGLLVFPMCGIFIGLYISWSRKQEEDTPIGFIQCDRGGESNEQDDQVHMREVPHRNHA